jgi:hypothetical protein
MPAYITHYLLGEKLLKENGDFTKGDLSLRQAFLLGCQGADIFLYQKNLIKIANDIHKSRINAPIKYMTEYALIQNDSIKELLLCYINGYLTHFSLDSTAHPFVFCQQYHEKAQLGLDDSYDIFLHRRFEGAIDIIMARFVLEMGAISFKPYKALDASKYVKAEIAKMYKYVLLKVFNKEFAAKEIQSCFARQRMAAQMVYSPYGIKKTLITAFETIFRKKHEYSVLCYTLLDFINIDVMNEEKKEWVNPFDKGVKSDLSFYELYDLAFHKAISLIDKLNNMNLETMKAIELTEGIGFDTGLFADSEQI